MSKTSIEHFMDTLLKNIRGWSDHTLTWCSIVIGHVVFLPTLLALITGISDRIPSWDIVVLVQIFLVLSFLKSMVVRDMPAVFLHALGWFTNLILMTLIVFK